MKTSIAALALVLLCTGTALAGTTYRVGAGCTYSTIQDAVDAIPNQGSGIIRIRSGTYSENVVISGKTVDLLGGHNDCTTTSATGITHIDASGSTSPAIAFLVIGGAAGSSHALTTDKLNLFEGTGNVLAAGGGVSVFAGADRTATVTLQNTFVRNSQTTFFGGGIALYGDGEGTLALLENSQIENNTVTGDDPYGGGLYCAGDYTVIMIGGSIHGNTAGEPGDSNARGGGIYLDGCDMTWFAQNQISPTDDAALRNNTAYRFGAGLYATGGAQVELIGAHFTLGDPRSTRPLRIHNNVAPTTSDLGGLGGAVFATGSGTSVRLDRTWVFRNKATWSGGAFYISGGALLEVERSAADCHTPRRCSHVFENESDRDTAVLLMANSTVRFKRTVISDNVTHGTNQTNILSLIGGTLEIDDSLIYGTSGHPSNTLFTISPNEVQLLRIRRSTIADNSIGRVFKLQGDGTSLSIFDSIIHQPGSVMANTSEEPSISVDCVIWHDDQLGGSRTQVADPLFVNQEAGLFYLQPGSPAINYCDIAPPAPGVDLDWNPRGLCHSTNESCGADVYDLGAYELPLGIFSDRFEIP